MSANFDALSHLSDLIAKAKAAGADAADGVHVTGTSFSVAQRKGDLEKLERSEGADIGLRVFVGKRTAIVSSSDMSAGASDALVARAMAMAKAAPQDPYAGLADPDQLARNVDAQALEQDSPGEPDQALLTQWAQEAEEVALAEPGITNSEGAEAGWQRARISLVTSNGFAQQYTRSGYALSACVLAGEGTGMERDYEYSTAIYQEDLMTPQQVGKSAATRAVRRLNPRKIDSGNVAVIYDPRVSRSIVGHLTGALNGSGIARGTSFLKDKMGEKIFADGIRIIDDPRRVRGPGSRPFDGEGIATRPMDLVADGVLQTWILDLRTARQLGLQTTGHAARGTSGQPSPSSSNVHLAPGTLSRDALLKQVGNGLYVTEMIGMGVNGVTGDYSRGATGFWIENGELAYPVSEITIAGNLKDMFLNLTPASDLEFKDATNAPTLLIEGMVAAGV